MPVATQEDKPSVFAKNEYLALGKVRAFPYVQLRNLLGALSDDLLPLARGEVQKLLSQLVYHLGAVSEREEECESFRWKADLYLGRFVDLAGPLLVSIAGRLRETPTKYTQTTMISELSSFFSAWDSSRELRFVARMLAQSLYNWSTDERPSVHPVQSVDSNKTVVSKEKRLLYLQHAIICMASVHCQVPEESEMIENFGELIRLTVLYRNLGRNQKALHNDVTSLDARCTECLCSRIDQILFAARRQRDCITRALNAVVHGCPDSLEWVEMENVASRSSACFQAVANGTVYAVNVLTGVVLVNGVPPTKLPAEIRESILYKNVFGTNDFDVVLSNGTYSTTVPVDGKSFSFRLLEKTLLVKEIDLLCGITLELLDHHNIGSWGSDLPKRLQQMHFFWATEDRSTILLREMKFTSRVTKYAITLDTHRQCGDVECHVFPIPPDHDKETRWILSTAGAAAESKCLDQLVILPTDSRTLRVLEKFDDRRFIHAFVDTSGAARVDFPRYQLSLEHRGDALRVREFKGFDLSRSQILKGALHGFSTYLVLTERSKCPGRTLLLFPDGSIQRQSSGETRICTRNVSCDASLHYHCLRVHPRYGTLHGMNTLATLQTAALHASTSMETNDSRFGTKGSDRALELVRQCFSTSPLSPEEGNALANVKAACGGRFPAVRLACDHLLISSEQVSFLFRDMSAV